LAADGRGRGVLLAEGQRGRGAEGQRGKKKISLEPNGFKKRGFIHGEKRKFMPRHVSTRHKTSL